MTYEDFIDRTGLVTSELQALSFQLTETTSKIIELNEKFNQALTIKEKFQEVYDDSKQKAIVVDLLVFRNTVNSLEYINKIVYSIEEHIENASSQKKDLEERIAVLKIQLEQLDRHEKSFGKIIEYGPRNNKTTNKE